MTSGEPTEQAINDAILEQLNETQQIVSDNMIKYGGGFVSALGEALARADANNAQKIRLTWPEYWMKYQGDEYK